MTSFLYYNNSDAIVTLIITNFHLYLMQPFGKFSNCLLMENVVYTETLEGIGPEKPHRATFTFIPLALVGYEDR